MKYLFLTFAFFIPAFSFAAMNVKCLSASIAWAKKEEAKITKVSEEKIKVSESKVLGYGTMLILSHMFVDGPNTGDNTHWEVAGEYDSKNDQCKILKGKRHWEH